MATHNLGSWPAQLALASAHALATGWTVGICKFSQVLMTSPGGRFETASERRAESFLVTFGLAKAVGNLVVGGVADAHGRRPSLIVGWLAAALMAPIVLEATDWSQVVMSDALLGLQQSFCWSTAIFVAVDLLGPRRSGVAVGMMETLGYTAIATSGPALAACGTGDCVRRMYLGLLALALACAAASAGLMRESRETARREEAATTTAAATAPAGGGSGGGVGGGGSVAAGAASDRLAAPTLAVVQWPSGRRDTYPVHRMACATASCLDPALMALCGAGLALNLATAFAWGAMTRWLVSRGGGGGGSAAVLAAYSMPKGVLQLPFGAAADRLGHRRFVIGGLSSVASCLAMFAALAALAPAVPGSSPPPPAAPAPDGDGAGDAIGDGESASDSFDDGAVQAAAAVLAALLGAATALAYTPLLACAAARSDPTWRASALGTIRFWRDLGYAAGGVLLGGAVDAASGAVWVAAATGAVVVALGATAVARACPADVPRGVVAAGPRAMRGDVELPAAAVSGPSAYAELDESR